MRKFILILLVLGAVFLMACGENSPFTKIDDLGWKVDIDKLDKVEKEEFKQKCVDPLNYDVYYNNPERYKGIMYAVTGTVTYLKQSDDESWYGLEILTDEDFWYAQPLYFFIEDNEISILDKITIYGTFSDIHGKGLLMSIHYIDKR